MKRLQKSEFFSSWKWILSVVSVALFFIGWYFYGMNSRVPTPIETVKMLDARIQTMDNQADRFVTKEKKDLIVARGAYPLEYEAYYARLRLLVRAWYCARPSDGLVQDLPRNLQADF